MGRGQHHGGGGAVAVRLQPVGRGHAPPVPRDQAREPELGHGRAQIVTDTALMLEEFGGHYRADRVAAEVFRAAGAASIPVETSQRISPTWLKLAAEHISVTHRSSIRSAAGDPQARVRIPARWTGRNGALSLDCMVSQDVDMAFAPAPLD